ncbi:MAG: MATE family efflux transporter [Flavonifractor plautii]
MGLLRQPTSDITKGVIWKQLLAFFFPLWFGTFFQQLYNTVDTLVVGRFVGKVALAAVGSTSVIVNLTVGIFTGLAAGAVVAIAQHFGARRWDEVHECVHTAMLLSILIGAFFMVTGFVLTPWALRAMGTTEEALPGAILYLRVQLQRQWCHSVHLQHEVPAVLRAIGDFRRPLYFLMAASLCNIVLDLLLVVVFHTGSGRRGSSPVLHLPSASVPPCWRLKDFNSCVLRRLIPLSALSQAGCASMPSRAASQRSVCLTALQSVIAQRLQYRHPGLHQLLWHLDRQYCLCRLIATARWISFF